MPHEDSEQTKMRYAMWLGKKERKIIENIEMIVSIIEDQN